MQNESEVTNGERVWVDCKHGRWLSPCPDFFTGSVKDQRHGFLN